MATARKIVLIMEYDGTRYHGFQLQAQEPTIQGETEKALRKLTAETMRILAASRTDAGVHARGQVVSFRTRSRLKPETFVKGLNYYLPEDIAVKTAYQVANSLDVRRDAISREYSYCILNSEARSPLKRGSSYFVSQPLDVAAMNQACQAIIGEHNFASFASRVGPWVKRTVRKVYRAVVEREGELTIFNIVADSFLPHQVRNTVGMLMRVGLHNMSLDEFCSIMEAREYGLAGPAVPACGLCLERVNYPRPFEEVYDENL